MIEAREIAAGTVTAEKVSATRITRHGITITDAKGDVQFRAGRFPDIAPVPRTDDEKEQWPGGLHLRDPHAPLKTDIPTTTAEEVW